MNSKFWRHVEDKTRAQDRRKEKARAEAGESPFLEPAPPLLVTLRHDAVGKLPAGIIYQFPPDVAIKLIQHRLAVPVGSFTTDPDLVIDEEQLMYADLPDAVIPLEATLAPALEAA